tara:strand:- start:89 stop:460 length:372 start_codon:yes stop_codon:yes gene_type:complete
MHNMNLQENYRRLFKGKNSSNDQKLIILEQHQKAADLESFLTNGGFEIIPFKNEQNLDLKGKQGSVWDAVSAGYKKNGKEYIGVYLPKGPEGEEMFKSIEGSGNYDIIDTLTAKDFVNINIGV